MSKVFIIIGILLCLGGAGLSFVNWQTETKLKADLADETKAKVETQAKLADETKAKEETQAKLATTEGTLETTTSELTSTKGKLDAANADLTSTKDKLAAAEATVSEKTAKVEELQGQVDKSAELAAQLASLTTDLTQARADLATATAERDSLRIDKAKADAAIALKNTDGAGPSGVEPGLTGKVQAVNAGWSFVVLNLGEKDGVIPNAVLDVYRDSKKIGQVKVSSVEPTISTANILETKNEGTIEPGDRVITRS